MSLHQEELDNGQKVLIKEGRRFGFPMEFHHVVTFEEETYDISFKFVYPDAQKEFDWKTRTLIDTVDTDTQHNTLERQGLRVPPYACGVLTDMTRMHNARLHIGMTLSFLDDHEILFGAMVSAGMQESEVSRIAYGVSIADFPKVKSTIWVDLGQHNVAYRSFGTKSTFIEPTIYGDRMTKSIRAINSVLIDDMDALVGGAYYGRSGDFRVQLDDSTIYAHVKGAGSQV